MLRTSLSVFLLIALSTILYSQPEYTTKRLTEQEGLSNGSVNCILQDSKGFIWIGTDYGLNRYDGYKIKQFIHDPQNHNSISHNHINTIYEDTTDGKHVLWIGTHGGGLNKFDLELESFGHFTHNPADSSSISDDQVRCIFRDSHNVFWIGTAGGGLNKFNTNSETFTRYQTDYHDNYSISNNNIRCITEDRQGYLWIGTARGLNVTNLYASKEDTIRSNVVSNDHYTYHPAGTVWEYDPGNQQIGWIKKANIPTPRWMFGSIEYSGKIYTLGGIGYQPPSDTPAMSILEIYDPVTDNWQTAADMAVPRATMSLSVLDDKIYAVGGCSSRLTWGDAGKVIEVYDPSRDQWTRVNDFPVRIAGHRSIVYKNNLIVFGGASREVLDPYNKFTKFFNPLTGWLINKASMKTARSDFASCLYNGKIYAFGGMKTGADQGNRLAEVYDPVKNVWKSIKDMPSPGFAHVAVAVKDKIWILGGCERWHLQKTVFEYDPKKDSWRQLPDLPKSRAYMSVECVNGKVYAFGGTGYSNDDSNVKRELIFTRFRNNAFREFSLPTSSVHAIYEDNKDVLWIGTSGGLRKLDRNSYRFIRPTFPKGINHDINNSRINDIFENNSNQLIIVTNRRRINILDKDMGNCVNIFHNPEKYKVSNVIRDRSGVIWAGTEERGVVKLIPCWNKFRNYCSDEKQKQSLSHNQITSLCEDKNGTLWIGTSAGILNKFNKEENRFIHYPFDSYLPILDICPAQNGDLWLARQSVLTRFDPSTAIHTDYLSLWLNSFLFVNPSIFTWIDELLKHKQPVASITKVGNNQHFRQIFNIDNEKEVLIIAHGEVILNTIYDKGWILEKTSKEKIWEMEASKSYFAGGVHRNRIQLARISLRPGTYELNYQSDTKHAFDSWYKSPPRRSGLWGIMVFTAPEKVPAEINSLLSTPRIATNRLIINNLNHIAQDLQGQVWCNINGQLHLLDSENKLFIPQNIIFNDTPIQDASQVHMDNDGVLWIGTENNGIIRQTTIKSKNNGIDSVQYEHFQYNKSDTRSLSSNKITTIFQDKNNNIWIGTDFGLNKYISKSEKFQRYSMKTGLLSDFITSLQEDEQNNIWISTNKGLSKFNPDKETFTNYTQHDGLSLLPFNHSCCLSKSGELYFGGDDGLVAFHPDSLVQNTYIPPIALTELQIYNKPVDPGLQSPLKKSISFCDQIRLNYDQNVLSFEFSALDFTYPEKNQYVYRLDGIDHDWIRTDASRRFTHYTNLDPGEYTFRVKGSNNCGFWNEEGTSINILITPPWWNTWWSRSLAGLMAIGILGLIYRNRVSSLRKLATTQKEFSRKLIESQEEERKRIASALHDSHGQNLLIISNELQRFQGADSVETKELSPLLDTVKESINEIRDISYDLHPHQLDRLGLKKAIESMTNRLNSSSNIKFSSQIDEIDQLFEKRVEINIYRIIQEGLNNIVKHSGANEAVIEIKRNIKFIQITITDNGLGFNLNEMKNTTGLGLNSMEERVKLLGGRFRIRSDETNGTSINIILPQKILH